MTGGNENTRRLVITGLVQGVGFRPFVWRLAHELDIAGWVRNLTKEANPSNFIDFGPGFGGLTLGYFPDPRTWGVSVGVRF